MPHMFSDLRAFRRDPLHFMLTRGCATPDIARLHVGPNPVYMLTDPALIRTVLKADEAEIDKGRLIYKLREVIGTSSLTISGPAHRERRGAIHKTLAEGLAGPYVPQIGAVIRTWVAAVAQREEIDAHEATAHLALRVICAILFGPGALTSGDEAALVEAVHLVEDDIAEEMFRVLPHTPWAMVRKKRKLKEARDIMSMIVDRTRRRAESSSLLAAFERLGLKGEVLRDEVLLMLLAGHHTTGTAAAWLLYHLAEDPSLAQRLAGEAEQVSGEGGDLTPLAIRAASTSRAYVQEVLRLYPSTYWMSRELRRDHVVAGRQLKRGTSLLVAQWHLHRDPRFWPDPDRLDLDRAWLSNPAYMPFGFGGRACVGLNVAMIELQMIALEFSVALQASLVSSVPPGPPKASVTLVPPKIRLSIRARPASSAVRVAA